MCDIMTPALYSILARITLILIEVHRGSSQSLQTNKGIASKHRIWPLPCMFLSLRRAASPLTVQLTQFRKRMSVYYGNYTKHTQLLRASCKVRWISLKMAHRAATVL
jgi:hypothetical protein